LGEAVDTINGRDRTGQDRYAFDAFARPWPG
jgi:hypothetical protein